MVEKKARRNRAVQEVVCSRTRRGAIGATRTATVRRNILTEKQMVYRLVDPKGESFLHEAHLNPQKRALVFLKALA